jgi:hypothetical protein
LRDPDGSAGSRPLSSVERRAYDAIFLATCFPPEEAQSSTSIGKVFLKIEDRSK